jgi:hypothetical protein
MPVNQNIQNFYRVAASRDFSRDFLFRVTDLKLDGLPAMNEEQLIYAKAASLPGRNITNVAVPYMGLPLNVPGNATYPGSEGYTLNFFLDANSSLRNYFEVASRNLFDDQSSSGAYGTPDESSYITLAQLDKNLEIFSNYKLIGASLRAINNIEYRMSEGTGQTVDVGVTISYHFYVNL